MPESGAGTTSTAAPAAAAGGPPSSAPAGGGAASDVAPPTEPKASKVAPEGPADESAGTEATDEASGEEEEGNPWGDPDGFDWDAWDGIVDPLPEPVRPWAEKLGGWHKGQFERQSKEMRDLEQVYRSILEGNEDPRVADLTGKLTDFEKRYGELDAAAKGYKSELDAIVKWVNEQETARQEQAIAGWRKDHEWLFADAKYLDAADKLLDDGWPYTALGDLVKLPESLRSSATEVFKKTGDADIALRLARAEAGTAKVKKPTTADFVSGSEAPAVAAKAADTNISELPFKERAAAAARAHLRKAQR